MEKSSAADNFRRFSRRLLIRAAGTYPGVLRRIKVCTRLQYFWRTNAASNALRRGAFICWFVYACVLVNAAPFSHKDLTAAPLSDYVFTNDECIYELTVPQVPPSQVVVNVQALPSGTTFHEVRKSKKITAGMTGTSLEFVFTFSIPGTYTLPSVPARIKFGDAVISFEPICVIENPLTLAPQAVCVPKNPQILKTGVCAGDVVRIELRARYFAQIHEILTELREDMLFIKRKQLVELPHKQDTFQPDFETIAEFDWIPAAAGQSEIPPVYLMCDAWNGTKPVITAQTSQILISAPKKKSSESFAGMVPAAVYDSSGGDIPRRSSPHQDMDSAAIVLSPDAKNLVYQPAENKNQTNFSEEQRWCAENIAAFRAQERNSFFSRKFRQNRIAEEHKAGLSVMQKNECPLWPFAAAGTALISAVILAVFVVIRHKKWTALQTVAFCSFFAAALFFSIPAVVLRAPQYAVAFGGNIRIIPEHSGAVRGSLYPGQHVRVLAEISGWSRISVGQITDGWTESKNLIFYGK